MSFKAKLQRHCTRGIAVVFVDLSAVDNPFLHLGFSNLEGALPKSFSGLKVESLWLNGQKRDGLKDLEVLSLRDDYFTGVVPSFIG